MRITLTITAGPHKGREFTFSGHDTFLVGRSERAHFRLHTKDRYFSRTHFLVEVNPPRCRLLDMGSRNGTYVNGERVETADLRHGDRIKAGHTILRVTLDEQEETLLAPPSGPPDEASPAEVTPVLVGVPVAEVCPVCQAPVAGSDLRSSSGVVTAGGPPLCPACEEQARGRPQPIAGYRLIRPLGRGGMGIVYLAVRPADGSLVAVKTIRPALAGSAADVDRFLREAHILRQLCHPLIVAFRDSGEAGGQLFFAMDYVPGTDGGRLVKEEGPLPVGRAAALVCQLLEALEYAHGLGFVHRDIKPANLLITRADDREVAKLADFGLARTYQSSKISGLTMMGEVGGSVSCMAPEQITNFREAKPPVDQYGAAATLYHLLTGEHVYDFPPELNKQIALILHAEPVPILNRRADLPPALARIMHQALSRDPAKRFANVQVLRKALDLFAG